MSNPEVFFLVFSISALLWYFVASAPVPTGRSQKTIVFDFDGTLSDSMPIFLDVINILAREFDYPQVDQKREQELRMMSTKKFMLEELKLSKLHVMSFEKRAREECLKRVDDLVLFDGVKEVIQDLKEQGYRVGILSSNSQEVIESVLQRYNVRVDFVYSGSSLFGKSRVIGAMLKEHKITKDDVVYVGDELRDVEACQTAGVNMVAVDWGFNAKEAFKAVGVDAVSSPQELLQKCIT